MGGRPGRNDKNMQLNQVAMMIPKIIDPQLDYEFFRFMVPNSMVP